MRKLGLQRIMLRRRGHTRNSGEISKRANHVSTRQASVAVKLEGILKIVFVDHTKRKKIMPSKSPAAKTERRMRSKSPSRKRSRSRSRGRSKSPARKAKTKSSPYSSTSRSRSRGRSEIKPKTPKTPTTPTRRSARLEEKAVVGEKEAHETKPTRDTTIEKETQIFTVTHGLRRPIAATATVIGLTPLLYTIDACSKKSCNSYELVKISSDWHDYLSADSTAMLLGFMIFQGFLYFIPFGKVFNPQCKDKEKKFQLRCNGLVSFMITLGALGVCIYFKHDVSCVYRNIRRLAYTGLIFSLLFSLILLYRRRSASGTQLSFEGNTGSFLNDLIFGTEVNPQVGKLDIKWYMHHTMNNLVAVINTCLLLEASATGTLSPSLLFVAAVHYLYILDIFIFEECLSTSKVMNTEGVGFLSLALQLGVLPYTSNLSLRYLTEHPQPTNYYLLAGTSLIALMGYVIYRGSSSQKHQIRVEPYDPTLAHLEKIPTPSGKQLLVSGWWGLCRHPNYLGEFLVHLSMALATGVNSAIPYAVVAFSGLVYAIRQKEDDKNCRQKHGAAWERYCQRVKYRLIPYIY